MCRLVRNWLLNNDGGSAAGPGNQWNVTAKMSTSSGATMKAGTASVANDTVVEIRSKSRFGRSAAYIAIGMAMTSAITCE